MEGEVSLTCHLGEREGEIFVGSVELKEFWKNGNTLA